MKILLVGEQPKTGDYLRQGVLKAGFIVCLARQYKNIHLPRSLIASLVRDMNFDSDAIVIDAAARRLRPKIDAGVAPKRIRSVRARGYAAEEIACH